MTHNLRKSERSQEGAIRRTTGRLSLLLFFCYCERVKRTILCMLVLIGSFFFLRTYVVEIRRISGSSMEPALSNGKLVVIWKLAYGIKFPSQNRYLCRWAVPHTGDLVLYYIADRCIVKRCAAIEKTPLSFVLQAQEDAKPYGMLKVGSRSVALSRVQYRNLGGFLPKPEQRVPDGFILALGDNAVQSRDSRDYGFVSVDSICGQLLWN